MGRNQNRKNIMRFYKNDVVETLSLDGCWTRLKQFTRYSVVEEFSLPRVGDILDLGDDRIQANRVRLYHRPFLNHVKAFFNL